MNSIKTENKMGVMPVTKLIFTMSLPMIISMLVQALYNVVDSIFVARISEDALTAVSLAFPAQNLMIGFATGTGVGVNAVLSRALGEGDRARARRAAENGVFLSALCYLLFLIFGLFGTRLFFSVQTDDAVISAYGVDYLTICSSFSFGMFGHIIFERILQSTGKTFYTMFTQGVGAVINLILDPIFIFGYGVPAMGIKGAAYATVCGQIVAFIMAVIFNRLKNEEIKMSLRRFRPDMGMIGKIYAVGVPSIIMVGIGSIMTFCMNKILLGFVSTAAAVFGVYFRLQSFVFMPVFGLNNGVIPIIAYNYGANKRDRIIKAMKVALVFSCGMMTFGLLMLQMLPAELLTMFKATPTMLDIGVTALRVISLSYIFAGFSIIFIGTFQAFGKGLFSMFVSIARQLLVLVPVAYLFSLTGKLDLVWWAFPIAELTSVIVAGGFFIRLYKKTIVKLRRVEPEIAVPDKEIASANA